MSAPPIEGLGRGFVVTRDNAETVSGFGRYRKMADTLISDFPVPSGTPFKTPEGLVAEDEPCRIAFDAQGGVYPIRESVFEMTYQLVPRGEPGIPVRHRSQLPDVVEAP